ncbi:MAG: hypothetical protein UY39_C0033G0012 [Candidatus Kaiserbacteria bacterium GW2011_GWC2_49_12]|uniref:L-threonylcarbamoyladenylate synthase n=1 Tax=Candidatus Kaiserbacteria bacterium GW2011_GWC2_49_12 TaxID=1618675 RepID=A0A0G1VJV8_9BACT|nr:MAG: hypothetical protein UY39_C0033G0012 [Candidatus Kaiserbacteria bacterium GW2011_GWC2_49_12]
MMEIVRLADVGVEAAALQAAATLRSGGVIIYPTDTLYGLGADALSDSAVAKVKRIKGRDERKPIHAILANIETAKNYVVMNDKASLLARMFWPGSLTLIFKKKEGVDTGIGSAIDTFGVRVSDNSFALELACTFGKPYTGTSANRSGEKPEHSIKGILAQLGEAVSDIDLVIDAGELPESPPSTVVDVHSAGTVILREGAVSIAEVWNALRTER